MVKIVRAAAAVLNMSNTFVFGGVPLTFTISAVLAVEKMTSIFVRSGANIGSSGLFLSEKKEEIR
jgi:hypothetical protein